MSGPPTFFFSYARLDEDEPQNYLYRFFEDLQKRVARRIGFDLRKGNLGTLDVQVEQGSDWDAGLTAALAQARALVAIYTPTYFRREYCGKEFGVFAQRHADLKLDAEGALVGLTNVLPIRWEPDDYYDYESVPPKFLKRISDRPSARPPTEDPQRFKAVQRYIEKGMRRCVSQRVTYDELLDAFSKSIVDMQPLPPAENVTFATAQDAFAAAWVEQLRSRATGSQPTAATPGAQSPAPRQLTALSLAVHCISHRLATDIQSMQAPSTDSVRNGPPPPGAVDASLSLLLEDVWQAGKRENFQMSLALYSSDAAGSATILRQRLIDQSEAHQLAAVLIDTAGLPLAPQPPEWLDEILSSTDWSGLTILAPHAVAADLDGITQRYPQRQFIVVPAEPGSSRISVLRSAFVDGRGRVFRASTVQSVDSQGVPVPRGVGGVRV